MDKEKMAASVKGKLSYREVFIFLYLTGVALVCVYQLKKQRGIGFILLHILLTICIAVGIMVPMQNVFQVAAGIALPIPVLVTKAASFVVLAAFALYFNIKLSLSIK